MQYEVTENSTSIFINDDEALKITPDKLYVANKEVSVKGHTHEDVDLTSLEDGIAKLEDDTTKVDHKCDAIIASIGTITNELMENDDRNIVYININKLTTELKNFLSIMDKFVEDKKLIDSEKTEITNILASLTLKKEGLDKSFKGVITLCETNEANATVEVDKTKYKNAKELILKVQSDLNARHGDLTTILNKYLLETADLTDNDLFSIKRTFSNYITAINKVKKGVDDVTVVNLGGTISDKIKDLDIKQLSLQSDQNDFKTQQLQMGRELDDKISKEELKSGSPIIDPNSILNGFNKIQDGVGLGPKGLVVNQGNIACDTIVVPYEKDPVISLNAARHDKDSMSIDARTESGGLSSMKLRYDLENYISVAKTGLLGLFSIHLKNAKSNLPVFEFETEERTSDYRYLMSIQGESTIEATVNKTGSIGNENRATRFKSDSGHYISISKDSFDFYNSDYSSGSPLFQIHRTNGVTYKGSQLGGSSSSVSWGNITGKPEIRQSGYKYYLCGNSYIEDQGSSVSIQYDANKYISVRSSTILATLDGYGSATNVLVSTSDIKSKENLCYINEKQKLIKENKDNYVNIGISPKDLYSFIKEDLKLCEYNYNDEFCDGVKGLKSKSKLNFIAQDIADTKIGDFILSYSDQNDRYYYDEHNYISVIAGALQVEMQKSEKLEKELLELRGEIEIIKKTIK